MKLQERLREAASKLRESKTSNTFEKVAAVRIAVVASLLKSMR